MGKLIVFFKNINELIMLKHTIFALPFIATAISIAIYKTSYIVNINILFLSLISVFGARSFAMGVNRYLDRKIDIDNPRTKNRPSVDGRISSKIQIILIFVYALIFIISTYFINQTAFYLSMPVLAILAIYSYTKRFTAFAHIFLGFAIALAPLAGDIAISTQIHIWSIILFFSVLFWVAGFDILYSIQDIDFDKKAKLHSIPSKYGIKKSFFIVHIFHFITSILWILFIYHLDLGFIAYFGISFAIIMLIYENKIAKDDIKNINKAFFTVNGYISVLFFISILLDIMYLG
jgi:4-hydroxybenzoate polyprenyltransferase